MSCMASRDKETPRLTESGFQFLVWITWTIDLLKSSLICLTWIFVIFVNFSWWKLMHNFGISSENIYLTLRFVFSIFIVISYFLPLRKKYLYSVISLEHHFYLNLNGRTILTQGKATMLNFETSFRFVGLCNFII